ncbi:MAG: hypothetical protein KDD46_02185, partial [Bdellovibrionales bacterium]|nr:hypothetical protein [Bdellovibrionales bacterium]
DTHTYVDVDDLIDRFNRKIRTSTETSQKMNDLTTQAYQDHRFRKHFITSLFQYKNEDIRFNLRENTFYIGKEKFDLTTFRDHFIAVEYEFLRTLKNALRPKRKVLYRIVEDDSPFIGYLDPLLGLNQSSQEFERGYEMFYDYDHIIQISNNNDLPPGTVIERLETDAYVPTIYQDDQGEIVHGYLTLGGLYKSYHQHKDNKFGYNVRYTTHRFDLVQMLDSIEEYLTDTNQNPHNLPWIMKKVSEYVATDTYNPSNPFPVIDHKNIISKFPGYADINTSDAEIFMEDFKDQHPDQYKSLQEFLARKYPPISNQLNVEAMEQFLTYISYKYKTTEEQALAFVQFLNTCANVSTDNEDVEFLRNHVFDAFNVEKPKTEKKQEKPTKPQIKEKPAAPDAQPSKKLSEEDYIHAHILSRNDLLFARLNISDILKASGYLGNEETVMNDFYKLVYSYSTMPITSFGMIKSGIESFFHQRINMDVPDKAKPNIYALIHWIYPILIMETSIHLDVEGHYNFVQEDVFFVEKATSDPKSQEEIIEKIQATQEAKTLLIALDAILSNALFKNEYTNLIEIDVLLLALYLANLPDKDLDDIDRLYEALFAHRHKIFYIDYESFNLFLDHINPLINKIKADVLPQYFVGLPQEVKPTPQLLPEHSQTSVSATKAKTQIEAEIALLRPLQAMTTQNSMEREYDTFVDTIKQIQPSLRARVVSTISTIFNHDERLLVDPEALNINNVLFLVKVIARDMALEQREEIIQQWILTDGHSMYTSYDHMDFDLNMLTYQNYVQFSGDLLEQFLTRIEDKDNQSISYNTKIVPHGESYIVQREFQLGTANTAIVVYQLNLDHMYQDLQGVIYAAVMDEHENHSWIKFNNPSFTPEKAKRALHHLTGNIREMDLTEEQQRQLRLWKSALALLESKVGNVNFADHLLTRVFIANQLRDHSYALSSPRNIPPYEYLNANKSLRKYIMDQIYENGDIADLVVDYVEKMGLLHPVSTYVREISAIYENILEQKAPEFRSWYPNYEITLARFEQNLRFVNPGLLEEFLHTLLQVENHTLATPNIQYFLKVLEYIAYEQPYRFDEHTLYIMTNTSSTYDTLNAAIELLINSEFTALPDVLYEMSLEAYVDYFASKFLKSPKASENDPTHDNIDIYYASLYLERMLRLSNPDDVEYISADSSIVLHQNGFDVFYYPLQVKIDPQGRYWIPTVNTLNPDQELYSILDARKINSWLAKYLLTIDEDVLGSISLEDLNKLHDSSMPDENGHIVARYAQFIQEEELDEETQEELYQGLYTHFYDPTLNDIHPQPTDPKHTLALQTYRSFQYASKEATTDQKAHISLIRLQRFLNGRDRYDSLRTFYNTIRRQTHNEELKLDDDNKLYQELLASLLLEWAHESISNYSFPQTLYCVASNGAFKDKNKNIILDKPIVLEGYSSIKHPELQKLIQTGKVSTIYEIHTRQAIRLSQDSESGETMWLVAPMFEKLVPSDKDHTDQKSKLRFVRLMDQKLMP